MYKQRLFSNSKRRGIMKTKKGTIKPLMKGSGSCGCGYSKGGANLDNYLLSLVKGISIGNKHVTKIKH